MPHKLRDVATAHRLTRIKASLVRVFHVKQLIAQEHSPSRNSLHAHTAFLYDGTPGTPPNHTISHLISTTVQIMAHSFTCIRYARHMHRLVFDKVRQVARLPSAHLCYLSLSSEKTCMIVTSYS